MLRIPCSCGKDLKVNESLVGRKIKCPACGAVQVFKMPAEAAVAAKAKPSSPVGDEFAPQLKTGKPSKVNGEVANANKKAAKKGGGLMLWLVIGVVAVLLLGAAAGGGWYFFLSPSPPTKKGKGPNLKPSAGGSDAFAIKLFVPHKVGDKREVDITATLKADYQPKGEGATPELIAAMSEQGIHEKIVLKGLMQTLEVNGQGDDTKAQVTVNHLEWTSLNKKKAAEKPLTFGPGLTIVGTLDDSTLKWSDPNNAVPNHLMDKLSDMLSNSFFNEPESAADRLFGTDEKQSKGDSWKANNKALLQHTKSFKGGTQDATAEVDGTVTVVDVVGPGGSGSIVVEITLKVAEAIKEERFEMVKSVTLHLPQDASSGPTKKRENAAMKMWFKQDPKISGQGKAEGTVVVDIKYLGNFPVEAPKEKGLELVPIGKPAELLAIQLQNANAEWLEGPPAVKVSADYLVLGGMKPKPNANYTLYVQIADGNGGKKAYPVYMRDGATMGPSGKFANPNVAVNMPPKAQAALCDFVLKEELEGISKTVVARLDNVPISGTPPKTTSAALITTLALPTAAECQWANSPYPWPTALIGTSYLLLMGYVPRTPRQCQMWGARGPDQSRNLPG